jgi:tetratricopeptide (TPR) repeat protein
MLAAAAHIPFAAMYERALALAPRHSDALYNLGVACSEAGQVERAMFCYELTTHFNPGCAEAWNNLGVLHKEQDNLERAAECYMAALNIRPNFPQVTLAELCATHVQRHADVPYQV